VGDQSGEAGEVIVTDRLLFLAHPHLDLVRGDVEGLADEGDRQPGDPAEVRHRPGLFVGRDPALIDPNGLLLPLREVFG
jgi:hypothetical protein